MITQAGRSVAVALRTGRVGSGGGTCRRRRAESRSFPGIPSPRSNFATDIGNIANLFFDLG